MQWLLLFNPNKILHYISNFFYLRKDLFAISRNIFGVLERTSSDIYRHPIQYITLYALQFYKNTHYIKQSFTLHKAIHNIKSTHKKRKHTYYGQDEAKCWYVFDTFFFTLAKKTPQMAFWLLWSWTRHPCLLVPGL